MSDAMILSDGSASTLIIKDGDEAPLFLAPPDAAAAKASETAAAASASAASASATAAAASAAAAAAKLAAARYDIPLSAKGGAIWDFADWETTFFQDSAATTPVTADGDPVGCIRNGFGNTAYDLIQATSGARPTFKLDDGIPRIECAAGQGLALRSNITFTMPVFMAAGLRIDLDSGAYIENHFGFVSGSAAQTRLIIAGSTLARVMAEINAQFIPRTLKQAFSANYAMPKSSRAVVHVQAQAGRVDCRVNGMTNDPVTSPKATDWIAADSVANMAFGVNISVAPSGVPTPSATKTMAFFGGAVLFDVLSETERAGLVDYFMAAMEPTVAATDKVVLIVGDSTADDVDNADGQWAAGAYLTAWRDTLAPADTTKTVYYRDWVDYNGFGQGYTGWMRLQTGSGSGRVFVTNASRSGSQPSYFMAERFESAIASLPHVDEIIIDHGHNMGTSVTDGSGYLRRGEYMALIDRLRQQFPNTPQMIVRVHPRKTDNLIDPVVAAIDAVRTAYGDMATADVYAQFVADGKPAGYYVDDAHLTQATGMPVKRSVFLSAYTAWQSAKPAVVAAPLLRKASVNLLLNPRFDDFDGSLPDNWTASLGTGGFVRRSTDFFDEELGDVASVEVGQTSGDTYLQQIVNAVPYRGLAVTLAVRVALPSIVGGAVSGSGTIQMSSDGTGAVSSTSWQFPPDRQAMGDFMWAYLHLPPIPATANNITVRLHGGTSGAGKAYFGRAVLVAGALPKDLR